MIYTAIEILQQLDDCAERYTFPMLDNGYVYPINSRLTAYRDRDRWALIIEVIGFSYRGGGHNGITNCLHIFGNCLDFDPGTNNKNFLYFTGDSEEGETFDSEYQDHLNPQVGSMLLRSKNVLVPQDPAFYESQGVHLEEPPQIKVWEFLRGINEDHQEDFFATEEEIRARIPSDLPLCLKLEEWYHPDLVQGEMPSQGETFQMIAHVLETGKIAFYKPTQDPNNHWINWPEGGTL